MRRPLPADVPAPPESEWPYPPLELAIRIGSLSAEKDPWRTFEDMGVESKRRILNSLPEGWSLDGRRILDFGCGVGRTLRQFIPEADVAEVVGCDIDQPSIDWIEEHLAPPLSAFCNEEMPPLDRPGSSFDLIYALSVFTHLTEHWSDWLLELHRLLADEGILLATFLGAERAARVLPSDVVGDGIVPERTGMNQLAHGRPWDWGGPIVIHSEWWIREHWGRAFEILSFAESGFWSKWDQGFVVMRKRQVSLSREDLEAPRRDDPRELDAMRENVRQLGRQLSPFWSESLALRERQAEMRGRLTHLRTALEREREGKRRQPS